MFNCEKAMKKSRVFIVFCETVSPLGMNGEALNKSLIENVIAVAPMSQFNAEGLSQPNACEVHDELIGFCHRMVLIGIVLHAMIANLR